MNKLVSIIIPCFNDFLYVEKAVQSALDQTYENKEVILVDDGSNKETKEVLRNLEPRITFLIIQENKGTSAARNAGIKVATGEYILVLDSDDYIDPSFCEKAINALNNEDDVINVTCYAHCFPENTNFQVYKPQGGKWMNFLLKNSSIGNSLFLKKDFLEVGCYDEDMKKGFEDWEFYIRLHKNGGRTHVIPEILFHYRKKKKSRTTIANENKYELLEYIYLKHADLYKANFELFTRHLLDKIKLEERDKIKNTKRIDFRLGNAILRPFRFIKSLLSKKNVSK